jgi:glycosyltransferase involved in cell wall biosynthesis
VSADAGLGISVVLPVYAGADPDHLRRALESVFAQTHPADEVLVVEDGPLLPSHEQVLDELGHAQPSLRRVRLERNGGVAVATQAGVEAAGFPWIARMDADDIALPERFERQVAVVRRGDVDVVGTAMVEFGDDEQVDVGLRAMPSDHDAIVRRMRRNNPLNHPTVLFRRALALEVGGYRRLDHLEDYDLFARMWAAGARLENLPEPLLRYRADDAMFARRRQAGIHRAELRLQRNLHRYGLVSGPRMVVNVVARTGFRLLPEPLMRRAYRRLFHQR